MKRGSLGLFLLLATPGCSSVDPAGGPGGQTGNALGQPLAVAVDAHNIYVTDRPHDGTSVGRVLAWAQSGGDPRTIVSIPDGAFAGTALASDGSSVFYTVDFVGQDSVYASHLMRVGGDGGDPVELVTRPLIEQIALDADSVSFGSNGSVGTGAATGSIGKIAKTGGDPVTLASNEGGPVSLAINSTSVFWALAGGHEAGKGSIYRVDKAGGAAEQLAGGLTAPHAIVADEERIYWLEYDTLGVDCSTTGSVRSRPQAAAASTSIVAEKQASPGALALDGGNLYWSNSGLHCNVSVTANGSIARAPIAGGGAKLLADGVLAPRSIAVDASSVVYLQVTDAGGDSGALQVVAK
jgi:hypothetical protein